MGRDQRLGQGIWVPLGAVVAASAVIVLLVVTGVAGATTRAGLYATGLYRDGGSPSVDPRVFHHPTGRSTALPAQPTGPVLAGASPVAGTTAAAVRTRIDALGPVQGQRWGLVVDAASGATLYAEEPAGAGVPASTMKVLTTVAALEIYGPGHRFRTRVLRDPADPSRVFLVGGGDPYLAKGVAGGPPERASVLDLAARTAEAVGAGTGASPLQVAIDTSVFAGPGWNPDWAGVYRDYVAETSALWVDGARPRGQAIGPRDPDPAKVAADAFAAELRRLGVQAEITGRAQAPAGAAEVAMVESMPLENIVEQVLSYSDNDAAEVLFRHIGRSGGRAGSIADARAGMQETLVRLGAWNDGMVVSDGSGLSRANRVSALALTRAVQLAIAPAPATYRALATGMSVAGTEGTLAGRFVEEGTEPGRGVVRAKTGTLTQVHSLAGYVRAADGSLLVYAFLVNGEQDEYATRVWLDRVTSSLATCGCRS